MIPAAAPRAPDMSDPPFACPPDTVLDLSVPPSVNETRRSHGPGVALLDKWHMAADMRIMASGGIRKYPKMPDRFELTMLLCEEKCRLDLDNPIKAAVDYLRRIERVRNDDKRYFRGLHVLWGEAPEGCRLILRPAV